MNLSKRPEIDRFVAQPPAGVRAILIHGRDRSAVRERADALAARLVRDPDDPFDVQRLGEDELDSGALEDALSALSLGGGRRLVRVVLDSDKAGPDKLVGQALAAHAEGAFNPEAALVVEAPQLGKGSTLRKLAESVQGAAALILYDDEPGDLARLVREALQADGVSLTGPALQVLVARLPRELGVARREVERLALYIGPGSGRQLDVDELDGFLGVEPEASLFDAAFDAFGARPGPAQAGLRRAFAEGESGPAAVRAVSLHLAKLRRLGQALAEGTDAKAAARAAGVFWKQEREMLRQARAWTPAHTARVTDWTLAADRLCKRAGSPDQLIAERLMLSVAEQGRRLGL